MPQAAGPKNLWVKYTTHTLDGSEVIVRYIPAEKTITKIEITETSHEKILREVYRLVKDVFTPNYFEVLLISKPSGSNFFANWGKETEGWDQFANYRFAEVQV